ncbi:MAG: outer membrane beta-barrel protein [Planctomycetota bacterium]
MAGFDYIVGFADIDTSQTLDNPLNAGIRYRSRTNIEPLEVEMGFGFGYDHESGGLGPERRLRYYEVSLGAAISKRLGDEQRGILEPYAGAGVALLFGRGDVAEVGGWKDYTDTTSGLYAHAGLRVYMFKGQFIALDYRAMTGAELDLGLGDSDFDSTQVSVILGFSY